jgi:hypothetical protein
MERLSITGYNGGRTFLSFFAVAAHHRYIILRPKLSPSKVMLGKSNTSSGGEYEQINK